VLDGSTPKVLLAEDKEENRCLIRSLAEYLNFALIEAGDGAEAIRCAEAEHPDLILMDLSLPVLDGWKATGAIKANPRTADIPVVALTAHAMVGDEEKARRAGADEYVSKPIDMVRFMALLNRLLGRETP